MLVDKPLVENSIIEPSFAVQYSRSGGKELLITFGANNGLTNYTSIPTAEYVANLLFSALKEALKFAWGVNISGEGYDMTIHPLVGKNVAQIAFSLEASEISDIAKFAAAFTECFTKLDPGLGLQEFWSAHVANFDAGLRKCLISSDYGTVAVQIARNTSHFKAQYLGSSAQVAGT